MIQEGLDSSLDTGPRERLLCGGRTEATAHRGDDHRILGFKRFLKSRKRMNRRRAGRGALVGFGAYLPTRWLLGRTISSVPTLRDASTRSAIAAQADSANATSVLRYDAWPLFGRKAGGKFAGPPNGLTQSGLLGRPDESIDATEFRKSRVRCARKRGNATPL